MRWMLPPPVRQPELWQTDRQTDRQTIRQTKRHTTRQTEILGSVVRHWAREGTHPPGSHSGHPRRNPQIWVNHQACASLTVSTDSSQFHLANPSLFNSFTPPARSPQSTLAAYTPAAGTLREAVPPAPSSTHCQDSWPSPTSAPRLRKSACQLLSSGEPA